MPPRNSTTKAFRPYHYDKSPTAVKIPINKIYDLILKPEESLDNEISKDFNAYKKRMEDRGVDISESILKIFKDDDDGDPRYVNTEWYKSKLEGE